MICFQGFQRTLLVIIDTIFLRAFLPTSLIPTDIGILADMGVLYNLSKPNMLDVLTRSGLSHLTQKELAKIMEAAILMSPVSFLPLFSALDPL